MPPAARIEFIDDIPAKKCPHCTNSDMSMIELIWQTAYAYYYICQVCSRSFSVKK